MQANANQRPHLPAHSPDATVAPESSMQVSCVGVLSLRERRKFLSGGSLP